MAFGYYPNNEKVNIDYSHCQPITVIANFNPEGKIMPVYISLKDLYDNVCKTKIEGIKYTKDLDGRISYCCVYNAGKRQREILLTYYIYAHLWVLEN